VVNEPIPLLLVTGSPGAGKTTFLGHLLDDPDFLDTAMLAGGLEAGGFDRHLLAQRPHRVPQPSLRGHERAVFEASGLVHPQPILADLAADQRFRLQGIVTVVDALERPQRLEARPETRAQAAVADALVIAKTDLASEQEVERLAMALAKLNPDAQILRAGREPADAREVWDAAGCAAGREMRRLRASLAVDAPGQPPADAIHAFTVRFGSPVELSGFCARLVAFLEAHADQVLRVKGLVAAEGRGGPAVIQGVGRKLYPVRTLRTWPADIDGSVLLVTAQGIPEERIGAAIREVCDGP
jgi:G3E family GTPase